MSAIDERDAQRAEQIAKDKAEAQAEYARRMKDLMDAQRAHLAPTVWDVFAYDVTGWDI